MRAPSKAIINHIQFVIDKKKIQRLKLTDSVKKNKTIILLFESHMNGALTLAVAKKIKKKFDIELCALESPIEDTKDLEQKKFSDFKCMLESGEVVDDLVYGKALKNFCREAEKDGTSVVCIDKPQIDDPQFNKDSDVENYMKALNKKFKECNRGFDFFRNDFMCHTLYHFTNATTILTINGFLHSADLINNFRLMDEDAKLIGVHINNTLEKNANIKVRDSKIIELTIGFESQLTENLVTDLVTLIKKQIQEQSFKVSWSSPAGDQDAKATSASVFQLPVGVATVTNLFAGLSLQNNTPQNASRESNSVENTSKVGGQRKDESPSSDSKSEESSSSRPIKQSRR